MLVTLGKKNTFGITFENNNLEKYTFDQFFFFFGKIHVGKYTLEIKI